MDLVLLIQISVFLGVLWLLAFMVVLSFVILRLLTLVFQEDDGEDQILFLDEDDPDHQTEASEEDASRYII